ncbi:hypothetical protein ACTMTI_48770 [Nonomuraea sp. H19]|uniref:hypothetical protein n=1 Tax=Nonomuraea sp. H19 TaxID=3452206 RepID=UPI003F8B5BB5
MLDTVLGLLVVAALPLAITAIPNTLSVVAKLLPGDIDQIGLMRTHGLALPALMLTVPLAAVALRRANPAYVLLGALGLMALTDVAGGFAASELLVGAVRVLRGIGAGLIVAATLAAVWGRAPVLRALWVGVFTLSLLAAQALALWPLDNVDSWRVTLQPYPMVTGVALALAAFYLVAWMLLGRPAAPGPDVRERNRLLLAAVPAAGISVAAISTATEGWRAIPVILLAAVAIVGLLALASIGTAESRTMAYSMVAVGAVLLPSAAQVTLVEMGGLGGPGLRGLWVPFGVAGVLAVAASAVVRVFAGASGRWLAPLGLLSMVVGLCSVRLVVPSAEGLVLAVPFTLLAVGAAVALTSALQEVGAGGAVFGLSLCFAGVLAGFLLGTGVQMAMLDGVKSAQELVDSFVGALRWWALIGGFLLVAITVLAAVMARRSGGGVVAAESGSDDGLPSAGDRAAGRLDGDVLVVPASSQQGGDPADDGGERAGGDERGDAGSDADERLGAEDAGRGVEPADVAEEDQPTGAIPRVVLPVSSQGAFDKVKPRGEAGEPGSSPAVPPQGHSPEDAASP